MATLLQTGLGSLTTVAIVAGALIAVLAIGSFTYQIATDRRAEDGETVNDGRTADDGGTADDATDDVRRGDDDDEEWKYY